MNRTKSRPGRGAENTFGGITDSADGSLKDFSVHIYVANATRKELTAIDGQFDRKRAGEIAKLHSSRLLSLKEALILASDASISRNLAERQYWLGGEYALDEGFYRIDRRDWHLERVPGSVWIDLPREEKVVYRGKGVGPAALRIRDEQSRYLVEIVEARASEAGIILVGN